MKSKIFFNILLVPAVWVFFACVFSCKTKTGTGSVEHTLSKLASADLEKYSPSNFGNEEWYMPYYLKYFSELANAVVDSGPNRGYIDISVWRSEPVNKPYDARIMENIMSLAWFYTQQRDWNKYCNDPALKARLEAALTFWCNMQNEDGRFSEYDYNKWSLAPTAFATKFVGRALYLLKNSEPKIDDSVFQRAVQAWRKALYVGFTSEDLWEHGRNYSNQFANFWGGALMYLEQYPDPELEQLFRKRLNESMTEFQSPCGFFYEKGGTDWGYNLSTHHSDLHMAWNFARGTDLQDVFVEKTQRWYDWFSYNALKEPGSDCYYLNRAIETRQRKGFYEPSKMEDPAVKRWVPESEFVESARAFETSTEELAASEQLKYEEMEQKYPEVAPLEIGTFNAFSPYAFVHEGLVSWHPTREQKEKSVQELPYLKSNRFIQVRFDGRSNTTYTFCRKPTYYVTFNGGKLISEQQRYGLGLIWNPEMGTVFQSQSKTDVAAYGTKAKQAEQVYEAGDLFPDYNVDGKPVSFQDAINNLDADNLSLRYPLGQSGEKTIQIQEDKISVSVKHSANFSEILPLLVGEDDQLEIKQSSIVLSNKKGKFEITVSNAQKISKISFQSDLEYKQCIVIKIDATGTLNYEMSFESSI